MLTITNNTQNPKIGKAIHIVMTHYNDESFLRAFKETTFSCKTTYSMIIAQMEKEHAPITIDCFRPKWCLSKAVAKYADTPTATISFNKYVIGDLEISDLIEAIFHEVCHHWGFTHITNYRTDYNLETVPYKLSAMFQRYIITYHSTEILY
jgi:hypothetical protein